MNETLREKIKNYLEQEFAEPMSKKLEKGHGLDNFIVNPFILVTLSSGVFGESTSMNMAKSLLYPRVFGTSISTSFGDKMQRLCVQHLGARASAIPGMDIEFEDKKEEQTIIMQLKAGPNTINSGDVKPMVEEMVSAYRLLQQNKVTQMPTFALGAIYGSLEEVSAHYKKIRDSGVGAQQSIPIYIGQDFWHRLTGNSNFYLEMLKIFISLFKEVNHASLLEENLQSLAKEIEEKYFTGGEFDPDKI